MKTKKTANFSHQQHLFDPDQARRVALVGAGSVGSWTALFLCKMGVREIEIWDGDTVMSHNCPMSAYKNRHIGQHKVDALKDMIEDEGMGTKVTVHTEMYAGQSPFRNCSVVSCVDRMQEGGGRALIWKQVKLNPSVDLFCDTRLAAAYAEVLTIVPHLKKDIQRYESMSFDDSTAVRQICGMHGIVYSTTRAAGIVAANLAQFWKLGRKQWRVAERCDIFQQAA